MNLYASIAVCFIPLAAASLCLMLLVRRIRAVHVLLAALLGLLAVVPIAALQMLVDRSSLFDAHSLATVLLRSLVINGLVEEAIKMCLLFLLPARTHGAKDFLFLSMLSGLSLGCFESVIYLASGYENIGLRLVTAVLLHAACAGLDGLFVWSVRNAKPRVLPFAAAILLHGIYNYFAGFATGIRWFSVVIILLSLIECRSQTLALSEPKEGGA